MIETIDFKDLFVELGLDPTDHSGNLTCPFCGKKSFTPYRDNGVARCHACDWSGNAINLYAKVKGVDTKETYADLLALYNAKAIKLKPKTRKEAVEQLASDLDFLAWARLHFAFYKSERMGAAHYQKKSGYSRSHFTKVMNGQFDKVSRKAWNEIVLLLRQAINVGQLKKDMGLKSAYWKGRIEGDGQLRESVSRFQ
jgi:hypothetical protein